MEKNTATESSAFLHVLILGLIARDDHSPLLAFSVLILSSFTCMLKYHITLRKDVTCRK